MVQAAMVGDSVRLSDKLYSKLTNAAHNMHYLAYFAR
jgi:hypothetical protein